MLCSSGRAPCSGWGCWCKLCLFLTWLFCRDNCVKLNAQRRGYISIQLPWLLILKKLPKKGLESFYPCWEVSPSSSPQGAVPRSVPAGTARLPAAIPSTSALFDAGRNLLLLLLPAMGENHIRGPSESLEEQSEWGKNCCFRQQPLCPGSPSFQIHLQHSSIQTPLAPHVLQE